MAKVGKFVVDPKVGAYCRITLDSGEKILVNHDKGTSRAGRLTIEVTKLLGFGSEQIFTCDLDDPAGQAAVAALTRNAPEGSVGATPIGALVELAKDCPSVNDVKTRCAALLSRARAEG
jgi:hypothetical protein